MATSYESPEFCHVEVEDKIPISAIPRAVGKPSPAKSQTLLSPSVMSLPAMIHLHMV
jgi:hypothetical protein